MVALSLLVAFLFLAEAFLIWTDQLERIRSEQAYWRARDNRPELYDWAEELDL